MSTESPTGISAEFQNHLRLECEDKLNETVYTNLSKFCTHLFKNWMFMNVGSWKVNCN